MLYLVYDTGEQAKVHHALVPVNCAFAGVAQGTFQLADVGGVDLPLVGRPPDKAAAEPDLDLNANQVPELTPTEVLGCQPEPLFTAAIGHGLDHASVTALEKEDDRAENPEEGVFSDHYLSGEKPS
jgi:hypothetical protein|tara:strand:+ start:953 stop:1330 length:378 start_codon:yes stop_codon:yes gene_type:complete